MGLFEDFILQEAVPRKAKELGITPDTPPDLTKPNGGQQDNQQPVDQTTQDPNATPDSSPAIAVTILNVDPGAYPPCIALLNNALLSKYSLYFACVIPL